MREEIEIAKGLKVAYSGIFDFDDLYASLKDWLQFKGYGDEKETFKESKYEERMMGDSKKLDISWTAEKKVGNYFSNVLTLTFQIIGLKEVEIEKEGVKIKSNKADLEIRIDAKVIKDPDNKLGSFLGAIFDKTIYKSRIEEHKNDFYNFVYSFQKEIKNFLELKNF